MARMLHNVLHGHAEVSDLDKIVDVANKIEGRTICGLGDAAAWPVQSYIKKFRKEFEDHIHKAKTHSH
jgi:NADH-quinone oxidoreductase subunit F